MKRILSFLLVLMLVTFSLPALSISFNFLNSSPVRYYTSQDWNMFDKTSNRVLASYPNGKKQEWSNPNTGNGGYVQALNTMKKNDTICRDLKIFISAHSMTDQYVFMFCKYSNGWRLSTR